MGVVRELAALDGAGVERLTAPRASASMAFQDVAAPFRQGDDDGPVPAIEWGHGVDEPGAPETLQVAVPDVAGTPVVVAEIVGRDDAKRPDRGERPDLRSPEGVVLSMCMDVDPLPFQSAWQMQVAGEDVPRVERLGVARVCLTVPAVVRTRIGAVEHGSSSR